MKYYNLLFFLLLTTIVTAQTKLTKAQVDSLPPTVKNQFIKVFRKSSNYQDYKVIKRSSFLKLQKNVLDSVHKIKKDVLLKQETINKQQAEITVLNEKITTLNGNLSASINKENAISLLGISMNKTSYNALLWSVIVGLLVGLLWFIYKFKNSNVLTRTAENNLKEIEEEFEQHRKKSIEKEQKLRRKLQDEINKQRGV